MHTLQKWITTATLILANHAVAQLTYDHLYIDYDSAVTYKNLRVIPIRYKGPNDNTRRPVVQNMVSLEQALQQGLATVQERGTTAIENVHWLSLYNHSDKNILVTSGDVLEGGRQDRVVARDTLVMARAGRMDLPVMCVEEGRWSEKDRKFVYRKMANTRLRKTIDSSRSQVMVWREINRQLEKDKIKSKTLAYLAGQKDKAFTVLQNEYWQYIHPRLQQPDSNLVGLVCVSGDTILGSDIFISSQLLYGKLPSILGTYIEEAIRLGHPPAVPDEKVHRYLDQFLQEEDSQEAFVKKKGKLFRVAGKTIHITTY